VTIQFGWPKIEERVYGTVNGVNRVFQTAKKYRAGTLVVFRNGQSLVEDRDNGWEELGNQLFRMDIAPITDDVVGAYYIVNEV